MAWDKSAFSLCKLYILRLFTRTYKGRLIMTKHHKFSQLTENFSQERQAEIAQKTDKLKAEITLHELRQSLKIDQSEARKTQENVNQYINHLRQAIESMGGILDITIHLDNKDILIYNFDELIENSCPK